MALPAVPSQLRGIAQYRTPVFDPRTGTWVSPGFNGGGLSSTGSSPSAPPATPPSTPSPPPAPTPTNPLFPNGSGGGTKSGLRGVQAERVTGAGDGGRGLPNAGGYHGRVDLTGPTGDLLDAVGMVAPGPLGMVATAAKAGMAYNNADISSDQLQAAGYSKGLTAGQKVGAVLGQTTPFGVAGNNYGAGDWRSVLDASAAAQRGVYDGEQTYSDPAGYKTSPAGPVPRTPTYTSRTAPLPGPAPAPAAAPVPTGTPPTGIRRISAGATRGRDEIAGGYDTENRDDTDTSGPWDGGDEVGDSAARRTREGNRSGGAGEGGSRGGHAADGGNDGSPNGGRGYGGGRGGGAGESGYGGPR